MNLLREKQRAAGHHPACSDSQDTTKSQEAALMQANLSKEQLDWAKQLYADTAPDRAAATKRANEVSDLQMEGTRKQIALGDEYASTRKRIFDPLEKSIVDEARSFDTEAAREAAAGKAGADVQQAFGATRAIGERNMASLGINPSDGAYAGMQTDLQRSQALGQVDASNKAREQVSTIGRAMKMDAASLGRNLPSNQATSAGLALTAGNSAVANANAALVPGQQAQAGLSGAYGTAQGGYGSAANIYGNAARAGQTDNTALYQAGGAVAGAALMAMSDVRAKRGITPTDEGKALESIEKTPVSNWDYKQGLGDGEKHTGPMAQDVNATMGEAAAPGGTKIDLISMNGILMAGVQALSKKIDKIAAASGLPAMA